MYKCTRYVHTYNLHVHIYMYILMYVHIYTYVSTYNHFVGERGISEVLA